MNIEEEQYIIRKIKDLDFLQERDDGNIGRLFDMIDKRDEKINELEKNISILNKTVTKLMRNNDEFYNEITELKSRVKELVFIQSNGFLDALLRQLKLSDSENKHLKERIRELKDELDIHQHYIAELESEEVK